MARVHPHGWRELAADAGQGDAAPSLSLQRELTTLALLADTLPDDIAIYHGIHWAHLSGPHTVVDDIDFVLVGRQGKVLLIEQVSGFLSETPEGLVRRRGAAARTLGSTLAHTVATLGGRLRRALNEGRPTALQPRIDALLHCPDYSVRSAGSAGLPPERIVDAARRTELPRAVLEILAPAGDEVATPPWPAESLARLHRFFADLLQLTPEASAIVGEADDLTTRLSGGLSAWARRLHFAPHRLRVVGTAGSGKTQLALALLQDAAAAGRRALYVCYNRPLADHLGRLVPDSAASGRSAILTFHQLCDRIARHAGRLPDFSQADAFRRLEAVIPELPDNALTDWQFDELIVDEGQDFEPPWAHALFRLLAPGGRAWWLEDPMQNLYRRPPVMLPTPANWVELRCAANYRTPRAVMTFINRFGSPEQPATEALCPILGRPPEVFAYDDETGLVEQTKRAIGQAIAAGFKRRMIVVLSFRGRERSQLVEREQLGPYRLRAFSGRYDLLGNPVYRDGEILVESVLRFKGQTAPCVILSEIAFADADENVRRRLFVGATRASMALFLVAKSDNAHWLKEGGAALTAPD